MKSRKNNDYQREMQEFYSMSASENDFNDNSSYREKNHKELRKQKRNQKNFIRENY